MSETLTRQMQDYFEYVDEAQGAVDLSSVREPRMGVGPVRPIQPTPPTPKYTRRRWLATAVASAAAVLVLGGLTFWLAGAEPDRSPADANTPTTLVPTTLAELPETGIESGTLDTPLGAADWVHLTSDTGTIPRPGPFEVTADGEFIVSDLPNGYWISENGAEWRREDQQLADPARPDVEDQMTRYFVDATGSGVVVPWVPYADATYARYWIIATEPIEIWTSEGAVWVEEDLSDLALPIADGFEWDIAISRPVTRYVNADGAPGTQSVLHARFTGPYTGQNQCHVADERLLILDHAGNADSMEVPWDVLCAEPSRVTLFGTSDAVYAYVPDWATGQISVWRTDDGYTWADLGHLHDQLGVSLSQEVQLSVLPALQDPLDAGPVRNQMVVVTGPGVGWESVDGVSWTPAPDPVSTDADLVRLDSGWFSSGADGWFMHAGDTWVSLEDIGLNSDYCNVTARASGQTTVFFATSMCTPEMPSDPPPNHMWIVSLDP